MTAATDATRWSHRLKRFGGLVAVTIANFTIRAAPSSA